jgi:5-methylcytosine-specific restriction endonuclease McrA
MRGWRKAVRKGCSQTGKDTPLESREMWVHVTAVTVGRHRSYSSWRTAPTNTGARREPQPEGSVCGYPGRCLHVERWQKGERASFEITKRSGRRLSRSLVRGNAETIRWNALEVLLGSCLTRAMSRVTLGFWEVGPFSIHPRQRGWVLGRLRESVKMVHRAYPGATVRA